MESRSNSARDSDLNSLVESDTGFGSGYRDTGDRNEGGYRNRRG